MDISGIDIGALGVAIASVAKAFHTDTKAKAEAICRKFDGPKRQKSLAFCITYCM